jgi:NTP pyrophosphatase (non-canonical NTP hydrolase)
MKNPTPFQWGEESRISFYDGSLFQPPGEAESKRRRELMLGAVALDQVGELRLNDYQKWVELDWKEQHFTVKAFERFEKGLIGEVIELDTEIEPFRKESMLINWKSREKLEKASDESISELGDVLWYGSAILSNAQFDLESCFREYLHNKWEPVEWGEQFTVSDVQKRIQSHTPHPFSRESVGDLFLEDVDEEREIAKDLYYGGYALAALMSRVFNHERITTDPKRFLQESGVENVGGLFLAYAAYHAEKTLGSSLEEVIATNVKKISHRAAHNLIDKADGERLADEI